MAGEGLGGSPAPLAGAEEDVAALLLYERDQPGQPLTEALLGMRSSPTSSPVREAADHLLRSRAPWALDLTGAALALIDAAGDERTRRLFAAWCLRPDGRSQGDLAAEEGVSAQRVGQLVQSAMRRVREALAVAPGPLRWTVRNLRERLGAVTTEGAIAVSLASLGANTEPAAGMLVWLAGPYVPLRGRPRWVAVDPRHAASRTAACLAADGGVRRLEDVESELADVGIRSDQLVAWLSASGATVVHDLAVVVEGALADAAERLLDAHGAPRSVEELSSDLAAGGRVIEEALLTAALRNRRFAGTAMGAVRLAAWGHEEPRPAPQKRNTRPRRARPVPSVRSRRPDATSTGQPPSVSDRLWLWVKVDNETLRGAEADVPVALVEGLGLGPPARRTFASRWGPVTLAYEGTQPTRGSVRAVALAAGARVDDTLLLGFSVHGDVTVEVRPAMAPGGIAGEASMGLPFFPEIASGGRR